jgi:hypothetical protein
LLDSATSVPSGLNNPGFNISQSIIAGQTLAFYISSKGTYFTYYGNGTTVGNNLASDTYLTVKEGVGKAYPFGASYTTRNFVGSVLYQPEVTSYDWNTGQTNAQISLSPQRSGFVTCNMALSGGGTTTGFAIAHMQKLNVSASANPMVIQSGQSSTLTAHVTLDRGIATNPAATNNLNGAMFDLVASDSILINGFTVSTIYDTATADFEVFYKTGTHEGYEANSSAWTSLGTYNGIPEGDGIYLALNNPLIIINGQTLAFYITRTDGGRIHYENGSGVGNVAVSAGGLELLEGTGIAYPFGSAYSPRVISTIVHFTVKNVTNAAYNWSSGGSSASVVVTPSNSTNYTVDVGLNGCTETSSVSVGIIGLNEDESLGYKIYPNPATNFIYVCIDKNHDAVKIALFDLTGKTIYQNVLGSSETELQIPISNLPQGLYLLKLDQKSATKVFKIEVL